MDRGLRLDRMPIATLTPTTPRPLGEQARGLRALLDRRHEPRPAVRSHCRSLAVTSGKGGVGKSVLTLNLAVTLAGYGLRVGVLDGHPGLGNLDLLCGRNGYWNLSHVIAGARPLDEVILDGPAGVRLVPGAASLLELGDCAEPVQNLLLDALARFESDCDFLLIDTGSGWSDGMQRMVRAAEDVLIVTTPEPTAIADAYARLKTLGPSPVRAVHVAVNQATAGQSARILERIQHTAQAFLQKSLTLGAGIPDDAAVPQSVLARMPFVLTTPDGPASRAVQRLSQQLLSPGTKVGRGGFFERLVNAGGFAQSVVGSTTRL